MQHHRVMATSSAPASNQIVVRPMVATDLDSAIEVFAIVAAEGRWIGTEADTDWNARRAGWAEGLQDPARFSVVAVAADGTFLGNGGIERTGYGVAELGMAVRDGWRGQGVGGKVLDSLVEGARELGAHKVALQVWPHNARALALYRSRGFVEEGRLHRHYRRASGELWDAIVMGLVLDDVSLGSPFGDEALLS